MFERLFEPIKVRDLEFDNRIVFPAMGTKFSGNDKYVTDRLIAYHLRRVEGGSRFNIVEVTSVHEPSAPIGFLSLGDDKYIEGHKKLVDELHKAGAKVGVQLWQGGFAVASDPNARIFSPSPVPFSPEFTLPAITKEEIQEVVKAYGQAARRAHEAGYDTVEFHAGHNYLPHTFLSAYFNHREDEYGGSLENRMRFLIEVIDEIRANFPEEKPVFMRVVAHDDFLENGLTIEDTIEFLKLAKDHGVDVVDVSRGNFSSAAMQYEVPPIDLPQGFNIDNAQRIKEETGLVTVGVGRINNAPFAEKVIAQGKVDMVVMGRAQLADPDFINKSREGDLKHIDYCVGCDQGCLDGFTDPNMPHITCLINPSVGKEREMLLSPAAKPQKVLVIGGGVAGMKAATVLKDRGHQPILVEEDAELGGQFITAGKAPRKSEMMHAARYMANECKEKDVDVRLNTKADKDLIVDIKPDFIINAIGASPLIPPMKGVDSDIVYDSHQVLDREVKPAGRTVVIGGGLIGMEVAELIAEVYDQSVTVLEMREDILMDMGTARKPFVVENIKNFDIEVVTLARVIEIGDGKVLAELAGEIKEFPADSVVIAVGAKSRDGAFIKEAADEMGIGVLTVGDAFKARRAIDAIREATLAAMYFDQRKLEEPITL